MNRKRRRRKRPWPNLKWPRVPTLPWMHCGIPRNNTVRITGLRAEYGLNTFRNKDQAGVRRPNHTTWRSEEIIGPKKFGVLKRKALVWSTFEIWRSQDYANIDRGTVHWYVLKTIRCHNAKSTVGIIPEFLIEPGGDVKTGVRAGHLLTAKDKRMLNPFCEMHLAQ
jgi:hypothetical protein